MSLTKQERHYDHDRNDPNFDWVVDCDTGDSTHCEGALDIEDRTFSEAVERIKECGWQIYKDGREWKHRCPICREEKKLQAMERLKDETHE